MQSIGLLDWTICFGYLSLVIGLGVYFSNKQKDNDDFFLGGRNMHWLPVGLSLFATTFSSNSFVGLPAEGAFGNYHQLLAIFFIPFVVIPITCIWFIPFYKNLGFSSLYEYLEKRFHRSIRLLASLTFMAYSAGWMGTMLLAVAKILKVVLETESTQQTFLIITIVGVLATVYTAMGGVKAVIWTDTIQAFALGGGMLFLLILLITRIDGGWTSFITLGSDAGKFDMFHTSGGFRERNVFSACAYGFFVYMGGQLASYGSFQRYITVDSIADARKSLMLKGIFTLVICSLFFLVGSGLYVYYQQFHPELYQSFSQGGGKDQLLPHFVVHYAGGFGMTGLILAGLFAAAMSSLDSGINSMTASLVTDWCRGKELGTVVNRCLTTVFGISVTVIACLLSLIDKGVFDILLAIAGATLGLLLSVLMMGMLWSRANTIGVMVGAISGLLVFLVIRVNALNQVVVTKLEHLSPGLHHMLLQLQDNTWWDGMFTTVTAVTIGTVVSYLTAPPSEEQLQGLLVTQASKTGPTVAS